MRGRLFLVVMSMALTGLAALSACSFSPPDAPRTVEARPVTDDTYVIGPGDQLQVFVWRNPDLSTLVHVRPDGGISVPLIDDVNVVGKTPTQVAQDIEQKLKTYVIDAKVTVIVTDFVGTFGRQIRVVGEAAKPQAIAYRKDMTLLDVMIQVGGLTQFAAGDRATIVRSVDGKPVTYRVKLNSLLKDGDMSANVDVAPGDVLMIPQSWF